MPIQFLCTSCRQAIEVDDEFANMTVTCPYCSRVVIAPSRTDLASHSPPPPDAAVVAEAPIIPAQLAPPRPRSILGWVALACILAGILCGVYLRRTVTELLGDLDPQKASQDEVRKVLQERVKDRPDVIYSALLTFCAFPPAGLILAIVALAKGGRPRWPAILALCLLGGMVLLACAGVILQGGPSSATG
jgi:DNA-directed RNA polymerase subunit RPC12/RpoP